MGFLKKFFNNVFYDGVLIVNNSSFDYFFEEEIEVYLGVLCYGDFVLIDVVWFFYDFKVCFF